MLRFGATSGLREGQLIVDEVVDTVCEEMLRDARFIRGPVPALFTTAVTQLWRGVAGGEDRIREQAAFARTVRRVICLYCYNNHFSVLALDRDTRRAAILDSMGMASTILADGEVASQMFAFRDFLDGLNIDLGGFGEAREDGADVEEADIEVVPCGRQSDGVSCGLFAIAHVAALLRSWQDAFNGSAAMLPVRTVLAMRGQLRVWRAGEALPLTELLTELEAIPHPAAAPPIGLIARPMARPRGAPAVGPRDPPVFIADDSDSDSAQKGAQLSAVFETPDAHSDGSGVESEGDEHCVWDSGRVSSDQVGAGVLCGGFPPYLLLLAAMSARVPATVRRPLRPLRQGWAVDLCRVLTERLPGVSERIATIALHYYTTCDSTLELCHLLDVPRTTFLRALATFNNAVLNGGLIDYHDNHASAAQYYNATGLPGIAGAIDGSLLRVLFCEDEGMHTRRRVKEVNAVVVCDGDGRICAVHVFRGKVTDAALAFLGVNPAPPGFALLADKGFTCDGRIVPLFKHYAHRTLDQAVFNACARRGRYLVENLFRALKGARTPSLILTDILSSTT